MIELNENTISMILSIKEKLKENSYTDQDKLHQVFYSELQNINNSLVAIMTIGEILT